MGERAGQPDTADSPHVERTTPIRVLVAKPGLDGHDRGAKVMVRALRDAGMEVIYTGLFQTPEMIAEAALQEDVDVVGLSILSGAHLALFPRIMEELRARGLDDVLVVAGGTIPQEDVDEVAKIGVAAVFGPGTSLRDAVTFIREHAPARHDEA
jgi:methylmalonyl-CoA mutase C-terminal domain/subunit